MRIAGIISALSLALVLGANAHAQTKDTIVCKSVTHCIDIVERHAPDSFDYQVLNAVSYTHLTLPTTPYV